MAKQRQTLQFKTGKSNFSGRYDSSKVVLKARLSRLFAKIVDLGVFFLSYLFFGKAGVVGGCVYLLIADSLFLGESLGKKLFGLRVLDLEKAIPCNLKQSIIRNLCVVAPLIFLYSGGWAILVTLIAMIPFYGIEIYIIMNPHSFHRIGDIMAETTVIGNDPHCPKFTSHDNFVWDDSRDSTIPLH
jgi:uncharacterized RDD family membrane protein YckC